MDTNELTELTLGEKGLKAMEDAVAKVAEDHRRRGKPMAVWRDGKVVLEIPEPVAKQKIESLLNERREAIDNMILVQDNLYHILWELEYGKPCIFRVAKESHLLLTRMMVEALRGTANLEIQQIEVNKKDKKKRRKNKLFRQDDNGTRMIRWGGHPTGCKCAWRYTDPIEAPDSQINFDDSNDCDNGDWEDLINFKPFNLLGFYQLLARIQTGHFMNQLECSKSIKVSDEEMRVLEWLHEEVRNKFEHFMPGISLVCTNTSLHAIQVCIQLSLKLLNESGNIFADNSKEITNLLEKTLAYITYKQDAIKK